MIDSTIAMVRKLALLVLLLALALAGMGPALPAAALRASQAGPTSTPSPLLFSPLAGEPLRGSVSILGMTALPGLESWELSFGYTGDPTQTWFLLAQSSELVIDGLLYEWDTTTISDGVYTLRLRIFLDDGQILAVETPGLRVRNYTPIETSTPAPSATPAPGEKPLPTITLTPTITPLPPTPTPLPTNPAQIAPLQAVASLAWGGGVVLGLFLLLGIYLALSQALRRR